MNNSLKNGLMNASLQKFIAGDIVRALFHTDFCDGTYHKKDHLYTIKTNEVSYFNVNDSRYELYELVERKCT
jgi:hypothetical protein